jgi:hypothetical protein
MHLTLSLLCRRQVRGEEGVAGWSAHVEEVLSWLLEAEDHLMALNSLGQKHLMTVKTRQEAALHIIKASVMDPNPVRSGPFCQIRIQKF